MTQLVSTLTCPECGGASVETMPSDACQFFYDCRHCGEVLRPLQGDCCVFCSYGDVPCPPVQDARSSGKPPGCCSAALARGYCPLSTPFRTLTAYGFPPTSGHSS